MILRVNETSLEKKKVLGDLLGDGRGALRPAAGAEILRVQQRGARHAGIVDAAMLIEILVLGGEERVDHQFRHRLDRQIQPAFLGVFAEQRAVRGMDPRHHRRLVVLELRIVGQILGEMPDQPRGRGNADQEHHGSSGEQETEETDEQSHKSYPVVSLPSSSAIALRPGRIAVISINFNCVDFDGIAAAKLH